MLENHRRASKRKKLDPELEELVKTLRHLKWIWGFIRALAASIITFGSATAFVYYALRWLQGTLG